MLHQWQARSQNLAPRIWPGLAGVVAAALLIGCGGGGGSAALIPPIVNAPSDSGVSATFDTGLAQATVVDGQTATVNVTANARLSYAGSRNIYIGVNESQKLLVDYGVFIDGLQLRLNLVFGATKTTGSYTSELDVLVCYDVDCKEPVKGSPLRLPVQLLVTPNVQLQSLVELSRTGRDAAPSVTVPFTVPSSASPLALLNSGLDSTINATVVGDSLQIDTRQLPAGRYERTLSLYSTTDPRYRAETRVVYTVNAPPGGELPMAITPSGTAAIEQGQRWATRLRVQRPTWTDAYTPPVLTDSSGRAALRDLGGDEYELSFDANGASPEALYRLDVAVSAAPLGGGANANWLLTVAPAFSVGAGLSVLLDVNSTSSALRLSAPVSTSSGPAQRWTATARVPWLRLLRSSGITNVDPIEIELNGQAVLAFRAAPPDVGGEIEVSIDRPGTQPLRVGVAVTNRVPSVDAALGDAVTGSSAVVYLEGVLPTGGGWDRALQISGATLRDASLRSDPRMVGDLNVLRLALDGLLPGRDVVVRMVPPLGSTEVTLPVRAELSVAAGYAALPYNAWRSAQFSLTRQALFFAAKDVVARWSWSGTQWALDTLAVPGLVDAAPYGDQKMLIGVGDRRAFRIDATSLSVADTITLSDPLFGRDVLFEALPPVTLGTLAFAADGAVLAASRMNVATDMETRGAYQVNGFLVPLTGSQANATEPGIPLESTRANNPATAGLVRSPAGEFLGAQRPSGQLRVYEAAQRTAQFYETLPAGVTLRGISEDGQWRIRSDGVLHRGGLALAGTLASRLPGGFVAGGYGLSGRGDRALVYGYRIAAEGGGERASDAALWVFDISRAGAGGAMTVPEVGRIALVDSVGCTTIPQVGETCAHQASVVVAAGDASAFVLGPRGVAAVPLPTVAVVAAARARAQAVRAAPVMNPATGR